jgi:formate/nitrite transporter
MADSNFMTPAEVAKAFVGIGEKKASLPAAKMFVLGILAGVYIGLAAHFATTTATGNWHDILGLQKLMIGAAFTVGLMLVVIPGAELFTGNNLMSVALFNRKIGLGGLFKNWFIVYVGNLIGSLLLAWMIAKGTGLLGGQVGTTAIKIAHGKVAANVSGTMGHNVDFFFRAIGCNVLVCLAVMMAIAAKDIAGKILAMFFPIMAFVASGFEHCVANMYFIPAGIWAKHFEGASAATGLTAEQLADLNWVTMWTKNLGVVTLGNIVGGVIFVGLAYFYAHVRETPASDAK